MEINKANTVDINTPKATIIGSYKLLLLLIPFFYESSVMLVVETFVKCSIFKYKNFLFYNNIDLN